MTNPSDNDDGPAKQGEETKTTTEGNDEDLKVEETSGTATGKDDSVGKAEQCDGDASATKLESKAQGSNEVADETDISPDNSQPTAMEIEDDKQAISSVGKEVQATESSKSETTKAASAGNDEDDRDVVVEMTEAVTTEAGVTGTTESAVSNEGGDKDHQKAIEEAQDMDLQALLVDLENKYVQTRQERDEYQEQVRSWIERERQWNEQKTAQQDQIDSMSGIKSQFQNMKADHNSLKLEQESKQERMDRMEVEADSLREEIARLTNVNKELNATNADLEIKAKLGSSEVIPLHHENQRLKSELDSVSAHISWMESELSKRSEESVSLRKSHSSEIATIRAQLDAMVREKDNAISQATHFEQSKNQLDQKIYQLSKELVQTKQDAADSKLLAEQELTEERRLVQLQREQLSLLENRHDSVVQQMTSLQNLAKEATDDSNKEIQSIQSKIEAQMQSALEQQQNEHFEQIKDLQSKLEQSEQKRRDAEDGLLALQPPTSSSKPSTRRPLTSGTEDEEPMSLTDLATKLAQTEDDLLVERTKRKRIELRFEQIQADIEAKAPILVRQRQEYELAMERQEEYKQRLNDALSEVMVYRSEGRDMRADCTRFQKRNSELEQETQELARQVQALLVSRAGGEVSNSDGNIPTSVEEIQNQNQKLLSENRRLNSLIEDLEGKIHSDNNRAKLEAAENQLSSMRKDRERHESMVSGIVQQRDLYRALLAKHDSKLLDSEEEITTLEITKQQSEIVNKMKEKNKQLEDNLTASTNEIVQIKREKETIAERLGRHEIHVIELTKSIDKLQVDLSSASATVARNEAEATYHKDKCLQLEQSLKSSRDELAHITSAKSELQRINTDLQRSLSNSNAEQTRIETELRQLEMKLRLADTQAKTSKASESRVSEENSRLHADLARQGALLDSVRRIEAALSAKNAEEVMCIKEECEKLTQQLADQKLKHTTEVESLKGMIEDYENKVKDLGHEKDKLRSELHTLKEDVLSKQGAIQSLTSESSKLESKLQAAKRNSDDVNILTESNKEGMETKAKKALQFDLEAAREEVTKLRERATAYQKIAQTNETAMSALTKKSEQIQLSQSQEVEMLKSQIESLAKESGTKQQMITDVTNDLIEQRNKHDKVVEDLKAKVMTMNKEMESLQKDSDSSCARAEALKQDLENARLDAVNAQKNYERELAQHASARTDIRTAREEVEAQIRMRSIAEEKLKDLQRLVEEKSKKIEEETSCKEEAMKSIEKSLKESRAQNDVLHDQLETLNDMIQKSQESRVSAAAGDESLNISDVQVTSLRKAVNEQREVVRLLRSEKDLIQAQLDSSKRKAERERVNVSIIRRSLDEARAEIDTLQQEKKNAVPAEDISNVKEMKEQLCTLKDQVQLLHDSNKLLREEAGKLQKNLAVVNDELDSAKKSKKPLENRLRELEINKASHDSEKQSLSREIHSWKGRVQSLVSKFNQIDPEEHKQIKEKVESLTNEAEKLKSDKADAESESKRIRGIATRLTKELNQHKKLVEVQKKSIAQLTAQKETLAKAPKVDDEAVKERDQLKLKVAAMEKSAASVSTELQGANERNNKLRERLRQFQKTIKDLRISEKSLKDQLTATEQKIGSVGTASTTLESTAPTVSASSLAGPSAHGPSGTSPAEVESVATSTPAASSKATTTEMNAAPDDSTSADKSDSKMDFAKTATPQKEDSSKTTKELPSVPPGGFNFGPSESKSESIASSLQEKKNIQTPVEKTLSDKTGPQASEAPIKGTHTIPTVFTESKGKISEEKQDISKLTAEDKKKVEDAAAKLCADDKKKIEIAAANVPKLGRRSSGETKEMSFKEKLLEKKRRLAEKMAKAQAQNAPSTLAEPSKKRQKLGSDESPAISPSKPPAESPNSPQRKDTPAAEKITSPLKVTEPNATKEGTKILEEGQKKQKQSGGAEAGEASAIGKDIELAQNSKSTDPFKAAPTPVPAPGGILGKGTGNNSIIFGQSSSIGASSFGTAFGQPTTFGASATSKTAFGGVATGAPSSAGGTGAFLDMKPPGSNPTPEFNFGTSSSIKLPMPSQTTAARNTSPFGVFSSFGSGGGGFVTSKPLFSAPPTVPEETKESDKPGVARANAEASTDTSAGAERKNDVAEV